MNSLEVTIRLRNGDTVTFDEALDIRGSGLFAVSTEEKINLYPVDLIEEVEVIQNVVEHEQMETVEAEVEPLFE